MNMMPYDLEFETVIAVAAKAEPRVAVMVNQNTARLSFLKGYSIITEELGSLVLGTVAHHDKPTRWMNLE